MRSAWAAAAQATEWDGCSITWADFTDDLQNAMQNNCGTETHAEYMALSKGKQADLKDVGGFVGGHPAGWEPASAAAAPARLITLDMDNCEPGSTAKWVQVIRGIGTARSTPPGSTTRSTRACGPSSPQIA